MRRASAAKLAVGALIVAASVLLPARLAAAHAVLETTTPLPNQVLSRSPERVILRFDDTVETSLGSIRVYDSVGNRVDNGVTFHPGGDGHEVAENMPRLHSGSYAVAWRVISDDGHPVGNAFVFSVKQASVSGARIASPSDAQLLARRLASQTSDTPAGFIYWIVRAVEYASLLALIGAVTILTVVWKEGWATSRARWTVWWSWAALVAATVATVLVQGPYASATSITHAFNPSLVNSVLHTRLGEASVARLALLMIGAIMIGSAIDRSRAGATAGQSGRWKLGAACLGIGLILTVAFSGHASTGQWTVFGTVADVFHLGGASLWIGTLVMLGAAVLRPPRPPRVAAICQGASRIAFAGVVAVVVSGALQAFRQVSAVSQLWSTTYGRLLLVKVALVCVLIGLGGLSRRLVWSLGRRRSEEGSPQADPVPALAIQDGGGVALDEPVARRGAGGGRGAERGEVVPLSLTRLAGSVLAELVVALAVLAVTAGLVNSIPPRSLVLEPFAQTVAVGGVETTVLVEPAHVGPDNQFHIFTLRPDGLPAQVSEVDVSLRLPGKGIGPLEVAVINAGFAHFVATNVDLPISGSWLMTLTVRPTPQGASQVTVALPVS